VEHAKELLDEIGIGGERLEMYHIGASDALLWVKRVIEMTERIKKLGPNPLRVVRNERPKAAHKSAA
jgi:F420-non-reducing hydrogenase iron-sulfur subunit